MNFSCNLTRCGIPVVIMGETGCGKTRLIRYMCDLAKQGLDRRNMLIMKARKRTHAEDVIIFNRLFEILLLFLIFYRSMVELQTRM